MKESIDLKNYFEIIKKRFGILGLITTVSVLVSVGVSFFILEPVYEASTTLIVNTDQNEDDTNPMMTGDQLNVTQKLAVMYGEIIKSRTVLENVIDELNLDYSYDDLSENIMVEPVKNTQIINIAVEDTNPTKARDIANVIPAIFTEEVKRITKANSVEVIDLAIVEDEPVKPNKLINVILALVIGMIIGLVVIFLLEGMDVKIKTPDDVEKYTGLTVLGVIPDENIGK